MGIINEKIYRASPEESYSSVKKFDTSRLKYYKTEILGDKSAEDDLTISMKLGSFVDCKLFTPQNFDDNFAILSCVAPSGQMGEFTEALCNLTVKSLDKELKVTRPIEELMEEAFNSVKYDKAGVEVKFKKKDLAWLIKEFVGSEAESYYKLCRSQFGKIVIDLNLANAGEKILEDLQTNPFTDKIINLKTGGDIEVIDQLPYIFEIQGVPFKMMSDRIVANHKKKEITIFDLKVTYTGEDFPYNYWKMKYYLQNASYYTGVTTWMNDERKDLKDYKLGGVKFIVASSNLQSNPLIYETSLDNVAEGLNGFTLKSGKRYKGLIELVQEIQWHKDNNLWLNSKEVYENKGIMKIRTFEETEE